MRTTQTQLDIIESKLDKLNEEIPRLYLLELENSKRISNHDKNFSYILFATVSFFVGISYIFLKYSLKVV